MPTSLHNPYRPVEILREEQVEQIHAASLQILETIGIKFLDSEALDLWQAAGAKVDHNDCRVWLERGLLLELVAKAPSSFVWRARNPAHTLTIGGNAVNFGPCGGMVFASDLERGRRNGTLADMHDFYRLAQMCNYLHFASWEQVTPQDVPTNIRHLHRLLADFLLTDKPVMESAHGRIITGDTVDMARLVFGDAQGNLPADPVVGDVINVNSPLLYDERMLGGLITLARHGQVTVITPFILAGAMSPITIVSALAQQNAEALAGIALTQAIRPGAPVVYGGFTTNTYMKSGAPSFGTPEGAWAAFASTQLARRYRLPYRGNGGLTTANVLDVQAANESLWTVWPSVLAHSNMVMHSAGWLEGGLTASFEKFVLDCESLGDLARFLQAPGTMYHSDLELEIAPTWDVDLRSTGSRSAMNVAWAHQMYQTLLDQYAPPPIDSAIREALQDFVGRRERELQGVNLYEYG